MRHGFGSTRVSGRGTTGALVASMAMVSLVVGACATAADPSPLKAPASSAPATVDTSLLDVGSYPTKPSAPLGAAGTPETGAIVEARRMANNVTGPWEVDPSLTDGYVSNDLVLKNADVMSMAMPQELAAVAAGHNFINGFVASRESGGKKILQNAVLRFPDAPAAASAAAEMGAAASREKVATPPVVPAPIPGHPDAVAMSHTLLQHDSGLQWSVVRSFTPHGRYVLTQLAQATDGLDPATALIAKTIDLQGPLIDQFQATDPAGFADLPVDPTGLLARVLPAPPADATVPQRAVYEPRGALHFQGDPVRSTALFTDAGMDLVAMAKTNVYQARDAAGAARIVDSFAAEVGTMAQPADPVKSMPASRCLHLQQGAPPAFYCVVPADRYAIEVTAAQLPDAQQQVAAQYTMLMAK